MTPVWPNFNPNTTEPQFQCLLYGFTFHAFDAHGPRSKVLTSSLVKGNITWPTQSLLGTSGPRVIIITFGNLAQEKPKPPGLFHFLPNMVKSETFIDGWYHSGWIAWCFFAVSLDVNCSSYIIGLNLARGSAEAREPKITSTNILAFYYL